MAENLGVTQVTRLPYAPRRQRDLVSRPPSRASNSPLAPPTAQGRSVKMVLASNAYIA